MKKHLFNYIVLFAIGCFLSLSVVVNAVHVFIPKQENAADYNPVRQQIDGNYSPKHVITFINDYLWFAIGFVCFLFVVINGVKLIVSRGDEQETSKAMKALIGCVIGIVICLSAYIIVNLALRLFA